MLKRRRAARMMAFSSTSASSSRCLKMLQAVQIRNAPKITKVKAKYSNAAAPTAMKAARITKANATPISRARCCSSDGTANLAKMIKKMNRLSTDRLFSTSHAAKYCWP
jgi:hypothetical protein